MIKFLELTQFEGVTPAAALAATRQIPDERLIPMDMPVFGALQSQQPQQLLPIPPATVGGLGTPPGVFCTPVMSGLPR